MPTYGRKIPVSVLISPGEGVLLSCIIQLSIDLNNAFVRNITPEWPALVTQSENRREYSKGSIALQLEWQRPLLFGKKKERVNAGRESNGDEVSGKEFRNQMESESSRYELRKG